jgi:uncharacterized protein YodC (DUF2158 family)
VGVILKTGAGALALVTGLAAGLAHAQAIGFEEASERLGLGAINAARACFVDLNGDGRPDMVVRDRAMGERPRVFLNTPGKDGAGAQFVEVAETGLPAPATADVMAFADLDDDGFADAVLARSIEPGKAESNPPVEPARTAWFKGLGEGRFGPAQIIEAARPATTCAIAVGDADGDGLADLYLGNWYTRYGQSMEAFTNDLLVQRRDGSGAVRFERVALPEDAQSFSEEADAAGRPTYGVAMFRLAPREPVSLLELNYGRRANRLWVKREGGFIDAGVELGVDGDAERSGAYPAWLKERAKTDPRFDRADEKPYRSHGNTFDAAIADLNDDGLFDLVLAEITHAWAGPSSDRTRILLRSGAAGPFAPITPNPLDRVPSDPDVRNWNQGDLFSEAADLNNDGLTDVLVSSGEYPDRQQLRVWKQAAAPDLSARSFADVTNWSGLNVDGGQQLSLADIDLDGDLDLLVGQGFNRFTPDQVSGRTPRLRLYVNQTVERRRQRRSNGLEVAGADSNALSITIAGPGRGANRAGLGAIVSVKFDPDAASGPASARTAYRQVLGPGGHSGKQRDTVLHVGLGEAQAAAEVTVHWPDGSASTLRDLPAGRHVIRAAEGDQPK